MSAISTILTRLRAAIWAIDVRDDIANAIEQCYSDVSNPTLKTEALEAALQNKIDQGEMAALTIGDGTITAAKLASGVIDNTLATSGAAADAKKTGDELTAIKADLATLAEVTPIPDNSDLNNYTETGLYSIEYGNYTILNYPPVAQAASYLEVRRLKTGYVGQKLTIPGNGKVFTRRKFNNGQWNNWIQITGLEPGLSADEKRAIIGCFENAAWANPNGKTVLDTLKTLWSDALPKYADLKYPNGDIVVKTNYHLIKGTNNVLSSESSNYFKVIGIGEKCDDTSPIAFEGLYGISIKGYSSITPTYSMVNQSSNTDVILMVTRIENGIFYVVSMGAHTYSGDSINISNFVNNDYYVFFNMRHADIITDVASFSIALQ